MRGSSRIRIAIVGAGLMGHWHAHFARRAGASVAAVVDTNPDGAAALAARFRNAKVFAQLGECLHRCEVDVVHVCTPVDSHFALVAAALKAGKHVMVEKPTAGTAAQTEELVYLAKSEGLRLSPLHQFPFQQGFQRLRRSVGRLGEPVYIICSICSAGGMTLAGVDRHELLLEILPHPLSLFFSLHGEAVMDPSWEIVMFTDDELKIIRRVEGSLLSIFLSLRGRPPHNELIFVGTKGTAYANLFHGYSIIETGEISRKAKLVQPFRHGTKLVFAAGANLARRLVEREWAYPGLGKLITLFYRSIQAGGAAPISDEEIIQIARLRDHIRSLAHNSTGFQP
ncbi:MAG: Gfo/Idh/MocA family oxidoreductase [Acidobacteria bacterium]|nr:Gfo/Idh/MocA family oxidoreductase [Acidobacteriota bacterium]